MWIYVVEIMHQKCNLQLVLSKSYKYWDSSPGGSFHQALSPLSDIHYWICLNFRSCRMMQWVGLAWCCLLLSSQVKSTLDPDQRSSPANATASQRALSVFSVVKVFFGSQNYKNIFPILIFLVSKLRLRLLHSRPEWNMLHQL